MIDVKRLLLRVQRVLKLEKVEDIEGGTASPFPEDQLLEQAEDVFQNELFFIEPREWHFWNVLRRWETKKEFYGL